METRRQPVSAQERSFTRWSPIIVWAPYAGVLGCAFWARRFGVHPVHLWTLLGGYLITLLGVEAGFHRHFAHQSFKAHPWVRAGLGIAGSMAAQGPLIYWLSNHIRHHALSDQPGDPHSPNLHGDGALARLRGMWHAHTGWIVGVDLEESYRYMPTACVRDHVIRTVNRYFPVWLLLGLILPAAIGGLCLRSWEGALGGFLWGGLLRIFLVDQAVFVVNSVCHTWGARPLATKDRSTNVGWLSLVTLGGSYHNNHHAVPSSPSTSRAWWQLDPSYWFIASLALVGLAWDVRAPRKLARSAE